MARNKYDVDERLESPFNILHLKRSLTYVKPFKKKIGMAVGLMMLTSILGLLGPYLTKIAIDDLIPTDNILLLVVIAVFFAATIAVSGVLMKIRIEMMTQIGQSIIQNVRTDLFMHLQKLPFSYYDSRPHGKILVRVVNYVNSISDLLSNGIVNLINDLFSLIFILIFMLIVDARLTLIALAGIPVLFVTIIGIKTAQRKSWQILSNKQSNLNAYIHESIQGMKVTQSFSREDVNLGIFKQLSYGYHKAWMRTVKINFLLWPVVDNISVITGSIIYMAGLVWLANGITVGVLIAFMGYIWRFWAPILNIGNFYNSLVTSMAYLERIFETMDEKPLVADVDGAGEMPDITGNVEFRDVTFSYEEGAPILHNVSFHVQCGDSIALVGPTGAGKTTIVNLLSRFYDLDSGQVLIDGVDIKGVTLHSLRKQMGVMLQDTFIFSGTVMDNIRYSRLDATDEEVIAAAKAVKAHDFIMSMKDGYQTEVNERGTRLSVGQRQLISFARALLANPRILILDEATSSIDTKTERALQEGLNRLLQGRTSFIIAHRLSTIKNSTCIMYIDEGQIVEKGTHEELMARRGAYWKLYISQYTALEAV